MNCDMQPKENIEKTCENRERYEVETDTVGIQNDMSAHIQTVMDNVKKETKRRIEDAHNAGEIYIDQDDISGWKIYDLEGNVISIGLKDWQILQEYANKICREKSDLILWSFLAFIDKNMCKECVRDCTVCPINDLRHAITRRIPDCSD